MTETPLSSYTLRLADDALILGHRLSEWCGHAPVLEEDLALANLAPRPDRAGALALHLCRRDRG
jgi:1,2-phenylacetyl-CoA epoxidase catalytic subunit